MRLETAMRMVAWRMVQGKPSHINSCRLLCCLHVSSLPRKLRNGSGLLCSPAAEDASKKRSRKESEKPEEPADAVEEEGSGQLEDAARGAAVPSAAPEEDGDDDAVHAAAADLFRDWLAEHKAQVALEEEVGLTQASVQDQLMDALKLFVMMHLTYALSWAANDCCKVTVW